MALQWQVMFFFLFQIVYIAKEAGITAVIQPGGSIKDH
jgi:AICAR transformylase/IMP cyclohydrolase PurH